MEALQTNTRISLSNILVTTDFSRFQKMLCHLPPLWPANTRHNIIVAHAVSPELHMSVPMDPLPPEADPRFPRSARKTRGIFSR